MVALVDVPVLFGVFFFANLNKDVAFLQTNLWVDVNCFSFLKTLIKLDMGEGITEICKSQTRLLC